MIDEIHVQDVALIQEATMQPSAGLTVLTGETGAGKTALLNACKLLMGERADKSVVREGAKEARVEGRFFLAPHQEGDHVSQSGNQLQHAPDAHDAGAAVAQSECLSAAVAECQTQTLDHAQAQEREVVVVRRLSADGRSRVSVNGSLSSVSQLSALVAPEVDRCGQHEHQRLLKAATHRELLDAWAAGEVAQAKERYRRAFTAAREARLAYERVQEACTTGAAALEEARFVLRQVEAVGSDLEEYDELMAYLGRAENAETLARAAFGANDALSGDGGALDGLNTALAALEEGARFDAALESFAQTLRESSFVMEDVARDVARYREEIDYDPAELADVQQRVAAVQGLMRTYGPRVQDVIERRDAAADLVSAVDDADVRERSAKQALDQAEEALVQAADALHAARASAAPRFASAVSEVMGRLCMGSAELVCVAEKLGRAAWTAEGPTSVEFLFRPGARMRPRPLARIASGGEISRVMLAVYVTLGAHDHTETLVFDEVDAGVGGATARALAAVLADLATTHQVIAVTHLPQIAACADTHYAVEKTNGDMPQTTLFEIEGEARVAEIARMLSGSASEASIAHARELLDEAHAADAAQAEDAAHAADAARASRAVDASTA